MTLEPGEITEIVRGPNLPILYTEVDDTLVEDPELAPVSGAFCPVIRPSIDYLYLSELYEI